MHQGSGFEVWMSSGSDICGVRVQGGLSEDLEHGKMIRCWIGLRSMAVEPRRILRDGGARTIEWNHGTRLSIRMDFAPWMIKRWLGAGEGVCPVSGSVVMGCGLDVRRVAEWLGVV